MKKIMIGTIGVILAASVCFADSFTSAWSGRVISTATRATYKNYSSTGVQAIRVVCVNSQGAAKPCSVTNNSTTIPLPTGEATIVLNKSTSILRFNTYTTTTTPTIINIVKQ